MGERQTSDERLVCPVCDAEPSAEAAGAEPETHCEWCGAEYPLPGTTDGVVPPDPPA
jgi:hypothetical protein